MNAIVGEGSKIKWGAIIAGAAIATGIILFAPTMMDKFPEMGGTLLDKVQEIGIKIGAVITGMFDKTPTAVDPVTIEAVKKITGVGLMGGGIAYFMGGKDARPVEQNYTAAADESFAMKEDMRKMQGLMVARAAAAGHPQAQAILSQQMGRL